MTLTVLLRVILPNGSYVSLNRVETQTGNFYNVAYRGFREYTNNTTCGASRYPSADMALNAYETILIRIMDEDANIR